jgi:hypothetical protein
MEATYLDLKTGKTAKEKGLSEWDITEGNWSCDCNRSLAFGLTRSDDYSDRCVSQRFIVIAVEAEPGDCLLIDGCRTIADANREYLGSIIESTNHGCEAVYNKDQQGAYIVKTLNETFGEPK